MADDALHRKCDLYELLYLRATEGARAANVGVERLKRSLEQARIRLVIAQAENERLRRERFELQKKTERLSLQLLKEWGNRNES